MIKPEVTDRERPKNRPGLSLGSSLTSSARAISSSFISSLRLNNYEMILPAVLATGGWPSHQKIPPQGCVLETIFENNFWILSKLTDFKIIYFFEKSGQFNAVKNIGLYHNQENRNFGKIFGWVFQDRIKNPKMKSFYRDSVEFYYRI